MIVCSQPECQTTAGCKCNRVNVPYPMDILTANATALEAKDKELAALREEIERQEGHHIEIAAELVTRIDAAEARAETAERELAREREAFQRHEQTLRDNDISSHSEAVVLVTELRRERDEAREALKALAHLSKGPVGDLVKHAKAIAPSIHALAVRAAAITGEKP